MNEKICRLCLQTISENYQEIGETVRNVLKLNVGITKDSMVCLECRNNLQTFFSLKSACVDAKKRALALSDLRNDDSLDPTKVENTNNPKPVKESKIEIKCSFCTKPTEEESIIMLHESKGNVFVVDLLEKYIPELNFTKSEELLTCKSCLDGMQNVSSFLMKYLDVEEKISKYIEIEGKNDKGQIELQDVQQFIFQPTLKFEGKPCNVNELGPAYDAIQGVSTMKTEPEVKYEIETVNLEQFIKTEDVDIKSEQGNYDSFHEPLPNVKSDHKKPLGKRMYRCETCTYETTRKRQLNAHTLTHRSRSGTKIFKCELCEFVTKHRNSFKRHTLTHRSSSQKMIFQCEFCEFETKLENNFTEHKLIHKGRSDATLFRCGMCEFETKRKQGLKRHILVLHSSKVTLYKCSYCCYMTKYESCLEEHQLHHKTYKCETCEFETKRKYFLNEHRLIHKDRSELIMFKCGLCAVEVKRKRDLNRHMSLFHRNPSEMTLYKCGSCTYKTKHKHDLKRHNLIHKSSLELTMFKCDICDFETKHKRYLKEHKLIHKHPSEITMFKCGQCTVEFKRKSDLNKHMSLFHKN